MGERRDPGWQRQSDQPNQAVQWPSETIGAMRVVISRVAAAESMASVTPNGSPAAARTCLPGPTGNDSASDKTQQRSEHARTQTILKDAPGDP